MKFVEVTILKTKLPVLIVRNMVLFPSGEVRLEVEQLEEKQLYSIHGGSSLGYKVGKAIGFMYGIIFG